MILLELTGIKKAQEGRFSDFIHDLVDDGKITIRSGSYGFVVLPKGKDFVWKVWYNDEGFDEYVKWALKNQNNPHALKISGRVKKIPLKFKDTPNVTLSVIKAEKLNRLKTQQRRAVDSIDDYAWDIENNKKPEYSSIADLVADLKRKYGVDVPESYVKTHMEMRTNGKFEHDMSTDNVMARDDGTLVIIDPFYLADGQERITATSIINDEY